MSKPFMVAATVALTAALAACVEPADVKTSSSAQAIAKGQFRGGIRTLVLMVQFEDGDLDAIQMPIDVPVHIQEFDNYLRANSYGRMWLVPTIMPPITLSSADCVSGDDTYNMNKVVREATLAVDPTVDFSQVDEIIVYLKDSDLCTTHDQGHPPGGVPESQIPTAEPITGGVVWRQYTPIPFGGGLEEGTLAHEFAHSMFASHLDALRCTDTAGNRITLAHSAAQGSCVSQDYVANAASIEPMNNRYAHYTAPNKKLFGWLDPGEMASSRDGTFTLTPLSQAGGLKLLEIPLNGSTYQRYTLEYRQPTGYDANQVGAPLSGVFMHVAQPVDQVRSVDLPPFESGPIQLSALPLAWQNVDGSYAPSYIDTAQGIAIYVYSTTPTAAVVQVKSVQNVARSSNGGVGYASSTSTSSVYQRPYAIDGVRYGHPWGGWWRSATATNVGGGCYNPPAWYYVAFSSNKTIYEVDVFGLQDQYSWELPPGPLETSTYYGLRHFHIQYWSAANQWVDVPNGYIIWNTLVWNQRTFAPINTRYVRVLIECMQDNFAKLVELEAYGF